VGHQIGQVDGQDQLGRKRNCDTTDGLVLRWARWIRSPRYLSGLWRCTTWAGVCSSGL